jgi:hypothetical protein
MDILTRLSEKSGGIDGGGMFPEGAIGVDV